MKSSGVRFQQEVRFSSRNNVLIYERGHDNEGVRDAVDDVVSASSLESALPSRSASMSSIDLFNNTNNPTLDTSTMWPRSTTSSPHSSISALSSIAMQLGPMQERIGSVDPDEMDEEEGNYRDSVSVSSSIGFDVGQHLFALEEGLSESDTSQVGRHPKRLQKRKRRTDPPIDSIELEEQPPLVGSHGTAHSLRADALATRSGLVLMRDINAPFDSTSEFFVDTKSLDRDIDDLERALATLTSQRTQVLANTQAVPLEAVAHVPTLIGSYLYRRIS
jgi:hypothetical protein